MPTKSSFLTPIVAIIWAIAVPTHQILADDNCCICTYQKSVDLACSKFKDKTACNEATIATLTDSDGKKVPGGSCIFDGDVCHGDMHAACIAWKEKISTDGSCSAVGILPDLDFTDQIGNVCKGIKSISLYPAFHGRGLSALDAACRPGPSSTFAQTKEMVCTTLRKTNCTNVSVQPASCLLAEDSRGVTIALESMKQVIREIEVEGGRKCAVRGDLHQIVQKMTFNDDGTKITCLDTNMADRLSFSVDRNATCIKFPRCDDALGKSCTFYPGHVFARCLNGDQKPTWMQCDMESEEWVTPPECKETFFYDKGNLRKAGDSCLEPGAPRPSSTQLEGYCINEVGRRFKWVCGGKETSNFPLQQSYDPKVGDAP